MNSLTRNLNSQHATERDNDNWKKENVYYNNNNTMHNSKEKYFINHFPLIHV